MFLFAHPHANLVDGSAPGWYSSLMPYEFADGIIAPLPIAVLTFGQIASAIGAASLGTRHRCNYVSNCRRSRGECMLCRVDIWTLSSRHGHLWKLECGHLLCETCKKRASECYTYLMCSACYFRDPHDPHKIARLQSIYLPSLTISSRLSDEFIEWMRSNPARFGREKIREISMEESADVTPTVKCDGCAAIIETCLFLTSCGHVHCRSCIEIGKEKVKDPVCLICGQKPKLPYLTRCRHLFCRTCFHQHLQDTHRDFWQSATPTENGCAPVHMLTIQCPSCPVGLNLDSSDIHGPVQSENLFFSECKKCQRCLTALEVEGPYEDQDLFAYLMTWSTRRLEFAFQPRRGTLKFLMNPPRSF